MKAALPVLLLGLAACAELPHDLPARPALRTPEVTATVESLARVSSQGDDKQPTPDHWWQTFGVADLDRLIGTALKETPDLEAAQARLRVADQAERLARLDAQAHYQTDASIVREHLSKNGLFPPPIGGSTFTQTDLTQKLSYTLDWWGKTGLWCRPPATNGRRPRTKPQRFA